MSCALCKEEHATNIQGWIAGTHGGMGQHEGFIVTKYATCPGCHIEIAAVQKTWRATSTKEAARLYDAEVERRMASSRRS